MRLRLINGSAMTYQDVRIPGLPMTVVQAHGNPVRPIEVDEIRMATAETYDVIVQPREEQAYSVLAESTGRQGFARVVLAPREGMPPEPLPPHRPRPVLTMADMGMTPPGPTGLDRGTPCPEQDQPGQVAPMPAMGDMADMGTGAAPGAQGGGMGAMPGMGQGAKGGGAMPGMDPGAMGGGRRRGRVKTPWPRATPSRSTPGQWPVPACCHCVTCGHSRTTTGRGHLTAPSKFA
ncbi:hypothetical protein ACFQY5_39180 [Paeniroseomonas aquatica]|uniref:hypothetical protein n=1 Tax=Paeniroseomonas aquatica TaxID=373043 RepID=UPI0036147061